MATATTAAATPRSKRMFVTFLSAPLGRFVVQMKVTTTEGVSFSNITPLLRVTTSGIGEVGLPCWKSAATFCPLVAPYGPSSCTGRGPSGSISQPLERTRLRRPEPPTPTATATSRQAPQLRRPPAANRTPTPLPDPFAVHTIVLFREIHDDHDRGSARERGGNGQAN